jgi:DNA-directed RNA polymerase specialized sigma24 family protein
MTVDPWTLAEAAQGKKDSLARLLAVYYPQVWRIAVNLTGRESTGKAVARRVMERSLIAARTWEHEDVPERWFRHHTVLAARSAAPRNAPSDDVLIFKGPRDAGYVGFVRAVRALPQQQREAILLNHGEDFDLRHLGIAMDCSVDAAGVHLRQGTLALQTMAGPDFGRFIQELRAAYAASAPDESLALPYTRRLVRSGFRRAVAAFFGWIILLSLIAAAAWGLWWIWPRLIL